RLEAFYDNPNALRDYFRDIGRMVLAAEGRKANDSHADCYQYFCVPEYGTANGRLHFHAVHFMRTLPTGSVDPNFGRRVRSEERRVGKERGSRGWRGPWTDRRGLEDGQQTTTQRSSRGSRS